MDKVERFAVTKGGEPGTGAMGSHRIRFFGWQGIEGDQYIEGKRSVIQIGPTIAIRVAPVGSRKAPHKSRHEISRLTKCPPGQTSHLEHLEPAAHAPSTTGVESPETA